MDLSLKKTGAVNFHSRAFSVFLALIFLSHPVFAERLPVKTYTTADGLPRDEISRIRQDSHGFLWFCTHEGISRFDGVGMTNFTVADGLPDRFVSDFLETQNGTIYIATGKGLARLNPHGLRNSKENPMFTVFLPDNPKAEKIQVLYQDRNNQVWVGTSDGLYKLTEKDGKVELENVSLGEPLSSSGGAIAQPSRATLSVTTILEDSHGILWIGTFGGGLFRLAPDGKRQRFTNENGLRDNKITNLLEDRNGRLWASLRSDEKGGVCLLDTADTTNPIKKCYTIEKGLYSNWVRSILETSDGQMWLATVYGLCRFQPENAEQVCKTYSAENDLCEDIFTLAEDKDGNLWTGSSCGVKRIARYGFTTYSNRDGLDRDYVNSIFENSAGELFVTTFPDKKRLISHFDGDKFSSLKVPLPEYVNYHGWGWQQTVWQDSRGAWWLPSGYGLFRSPDKTSFENLARAPLEKVEIGTKGNEIFRLFEDSRGDVWITTTNQANELLRWERSKNIWHNYTSQVGFSDYRVGSALVEDGFGNVWIGANSDHGDSALIRYRNGDFRVFSQAEGAPSNWIQDLFIDSRGRLWIASDNSGLWRLDATDSDRFEFIKYTIANGLNSNSTASVTEDSFGRIYIGTWRGIDRLNVETGQIENFTTADGLPANLIESSYRDRQNNLWFATKKGLTRFVPEPPRTRQPPNILITGLRVEGETQSVSVLGETSFPTLDLRADQRQITVDFLGLGASLGEKLKYEYRFGGADWKETTERTLNFANLSADDYRFEVRAQTADGIYSTIPASFSFRIAAPVWQRWWFLLSAALIIGFITYLIYKSRLKRLLELEKVRTRIATDLHDDIGANLTRISLLSEVAKQKAVNGNGTLLSSIADIARESVASMNDIVWAIAPEHDSLLDLTRRMRQHAEEVFALREIDLFFNAPTIETELKLSVGVRRDLLLIFKEAVNNAAKHSQCTKVWIDFELENSRLTLKIKDNGRGFADNLETDGQGLRSMKRRAESLGGQLTVDSKSEEGTIVRFEMTLQKSNLHI
jgi:ligand-binding sensor domain-containing protein/signal transduction histidine kinase